MGGFPHCTQRRWRGILVQKYEINKKNGILPPNLKKTIKKKNKKEIVTPNKPHEYCVLYIYF
jgi:hypothetical protein